MELEPSDRDTLKIFDASDNHLGAFERDPIRANDSFIAFEQILRMAKEHDVFYHFILFVLFILPPCHSSLGRYGSPRWRLISRKQTFAANLESHHENSSQVCLR
jgi:hypothetical protein